MSPVFALVITNLIWGAASPIFKYSLQNIPPFTLAFFRFFIATFLLLPFAIKQWKQISVKQLVYIGVGALFAININIGFFFLGLQRTESINAPIIASAQPVFLYVLSILFLHEKIHLKVFIGILISFLGVLGIVLGPMFLNGSVSLAAKETAFEGNLYLVIATMGSVVNAIMFKRILKQVNAMQVSFISFLVGSLVFIPFMMPELSRWSFQQLNIQGIVGIVFGSVFSSAIAYYLFNYGISKIQAQEVGIFTYIDPIIAVIIAIPLVHEYPDPLFFIGSLFVFMGIVVAEGRIHWHPIHRLKQVKAGRSRLELVENVKKV